MLNIHSTNLETCDSTTVLQNDPLGKDPCDWNSQLERGEGFLFCCLFFCRYSFFFFALLFIYLFLSILTPGSNWMRQLHSHIIHNRQCALNCCWHYPWIFLLHYKFGRISNGKGAVIFYFNSVFMHQEFPLTPTLNVLCFSAV